MYWSRKAESSAAIFLLFPFVLAFVKTIASPLPSLPPSFSAHAQFRFFLCVRLTDKVPPALILKKSPSLLFLLALYILGGGALTRTAVCVGYIDTWEN